MSACIGNKLNAVVLGISHFNKASIGREPLERVTGSIAFGALARVVLATAKVIDKTGQPKRILVRTKSNNGPDGGGYYYQIEQIELANHQGVFSSQVIWGEQVEGTAQELLNENDQNNPDDRSMLADAVKFLKVILSEGPIPKREVDERAIEAGIKSMTLRRAKVFLGVETIHEGYGKGSVWKWYLPPGKTVKEDKDADENSTRFI